VVEVGQSSHFAAAVSPDATMHLNDDGQTLTVSGVIIDVVAKISDVLRHMRGSDDNQHDIYLPEEALTLSDILRFFISGMDFAKEVTDYPTNEDSLEVFLRTFIRGPPSEITKNEMLCLRNGVRAIFARVMLGKSLPDKNDKPGLERVVAEAQKTEEDMSELMKAGGHQAAKRCFCITARGYFGLVPGKVKEGDKVAIFNGGPVPFILREAEQGPFAETAYRLVGDGYFHGLMHGEALSLGTCEERDILLV
jgi:hypothetical protein